MKERNLCHKVIANFQEQHVCLLKLRRMQKRITKDEEAAIVKGFTFLPDNERVVDTFCCVVVNGQHWLKVARSPGGCVGCIAEWC
jgi:hypothetical protein